MSILKPVELGCLALMIGAVNPENIGLVVSVVQREPELDHLFRSPAWQVLGAQQPLALEHHMMRIDGGEPETVQEEARGQEVPADANA